MRVALTVMFVVVMLGSGAAQWLRYPTPGVPRRGDGTPNLDAAPPRAADGRPDFSGIWLGAETISDPGCPADDGACIRQEPLPFRALHIGLSSPAQLAKVMAEPVSFTTLLPYQPWAADLVARRAAFQTGVAGPDGGANVDPHARCLPPNFPRAWAFPQHKKIVQAGGLLVVLHEFNASYRQIFTDGRPLPDDPQPSWNGYSSGRWDGDTLVVETNGFRDDLWLDMAGSPLTDAARVTERLRRVSYGRLEIQVSVNDSKAYMKPWTVRMDQSLVVDTDLLDSNCLENEQSVRRMVGK